MKPRLFILLVCVALPLLSSCAYLPSLQTSQPKATSDIPTGGLGQLRSNVAQTGPHLNGQPAMAVTGETGAQERPIPPAEDPYRIYRGTGELVKPALSQAYTKMGNDITLDFEGADLREVVKTILVDILAESYIMDPKVGGTVSLHTERPIPRAAVLPTLETVLRMNGAVLLKELDGVYRVVPSGMAGKGNLTPQLGDPTKPMPPGYSIQIVPLKYIGAPDMAKMLEPLAAEAGAVRVDTLRNLLILSGTELELRHMLETISMFDVDWISGMSVGLFTLQSADVKSVSAELDKLLGDKNAGPFAGMLRIVPIERLNAFLVVTPQAKYLDHARTWIERFDRGGAGGGSGDGQRLFVYPVQNGKAEQLATLLNDVFGKQKTTTKPTPAASVAPGMTPTEVKSGTTQPANKPAATSGSAALSISTGGSGAEQEVRIIADKDNNALVILASPADYNTIEAAIRKLDVLPRQVLVEVTIAEISLKDELKYGLEWFLNNGARIGTKLDTGTAGISALTPGFSFSWKNGAGEIGAVLNMLAADSKLKIISSPHVTVADNQTAKIQVGDRVPTISQTQTLSGTTTTSGVISSVQYMETGVMLSVTPRVNAGGLVSMDINQEVSNAIATTTSGIDSPTIQKRSAQSVVTVQSGETLVLAGLIKEELGRGSSGLPYLSEIPVVGGLFGSQSVTDNRTELIIMITPRVLHTSQQASDVTAEYRKRLTGLEEMLRKLEVERKQEDRLKTMAPEGPALKLRMSDDGVPPPVPASTVTEPAPAKVEVVTPPEPAK